jgi:hypothetical protein
MIVVWRGQGWAVMGILGAAFVAIYLLVNGLVPGGANPEYFAAHAWPFVLVFGGSGAIMLAWGLATNHRAPVQGISRETGLAVTRRIHHSFYFIPVEYWGVASLAGAIAFYLSRPF